ncbi:hypothetical protein D3C72_1936140 [compost metagenome]
MVLFSLSRASSFEATSPTAVVAWERANVLAPDVIAPAVRRSAPGMAWLSVSRHCTEITRWVPVGTPSSETRVSPVDASTISFS